MVRCPLWGIFTHPRKLWSGWQTTMTSQKHPARICTNTLRSHVPRNIRIRSLLRLSWRIYMIEQQQRICSRREGEKRSLTARYLFYVCWPAMRACVRACERPWGMEHVVCQQTRRDNKASPRQWQRKQRYVNLY